ncbi:hypothetical protein [Rossellomorea marisflavi]|uniref:hypothetical protein n=1 Tax=Rossellomorea marisflavi TaxID=189381 RepID=UPI003516A012
MSSKDLVEVKIKLIEKMKAEERIITLKKKGRDISPEIGDMLDLEELTISLYRRLTENLPNM